ncbi:hypothetical protein GOP47_0021148 [Adiantum capillus-veneris]|uniref:PORR domain-containing protein n=1 Tax=Adiantum capillus-veneris TaxID=13818 RepID=A0A9D4Z6U2_ADICA|nr:hypothetical protein GOP47_0021148 [Adiantum capillus-veneris]
MWASRALLVRGISVFSSSSTSTSWHAIVKAHCLLQHRCVVYNKITKNKLLLNKTRDSAYENFMDDEKKMNIMKKIIKLLLKQPKQKMLYRYMLTRGGFVGLVKPQRMGEILDKYPRIVRVYRNPNELDVWVTLARPIVELLEEEKMLKQQRAHMAAERLRKVLMMSATRRIRLDRINYLKEELGLPDNFKRTVVKANPHLFKLVITRVNLEKGMSPSVKLLDWDEKLAIPAIEAYRQDPASTSGLDEEGKRRKAYSFPINLPPGFKIKKAFRYKLRSWQELPYRSPYADTSDLDLKSEEAFKRAVAVVHEFLHITVEKRTRVDHLAHLREDYKLPQKLGATVLQNPGIFYMSTKSNKQTIFLREGYRKGELLEKDPLFTIKEKFLALIRLGRRSTKKLREGKRAISDSDTSDEEEKETAAMSEEMEVGGVKKVEGLEECVSCEEREEDCEESGEGGHTACDDADEEIRQESCFSDNSCFSADDDDDDCLSGVDNEEDGPVPIDGLDEDCSDKDENEVILSGSGDENEKQFNVIEKGSSEDAFETEDENCSDKDEIETAIHGSGRDENKRIFNEIEKGSPKDAFETEDDEEDCSSPVRRAYHDSFVDISKGPHHRRKDRRRRSRR